MSDILFTMEDGSQALMHYGVLGMKWGVRNEETRRKYANSKSRRKEAKAITKSLRNQDQKLRELTVLQYNLHKTQQKNAEKASKYMQRGKTEEYKKALERSQIANALLKDVEKDYKETGQLMVLTILDAIGKGYGIRNKNTALTPTAPRKVYTKSLMEKHGEIPIINEANAAIGNRFVVKDTERMSDRRKLKYNPNTLQIRNHTPGTIYYYAY